MIRFFTTPTEVSDGTINLSEEDAAHIRSLRLRPSEYFIVCDGEGSDYICQLGERGEVPVAEIIETRPSLGEPTVACSVYIALAKGDRLDYAVQKSVELGAHDIVLFPSARCVSVPGDMTKKIARLQRIALETSKQCGRGRVPAVSAASTFSAALFRNGKLKTENGELGDGISNSQLAFFLYECEEKLHLKQALQQHCGNPEFRTPNSGLAISIFTGPEGGFEPHEAEQARSAGLIAVTLGPRILRCETAPIAALAAIMFYTNNL